MENTDKDYHRLIGRDGYFEVVGFGKVHIQSLIDLFLKDLREGKVFKPMARDPQAPQDDADIISRRKTLDAILKHDLYNLKKQNMKPFNLEKALAGDPVITRTGLYVTIERTMPRTAISKPVVAGKFNGDSYQWCFDGVFTTFGQSDLDLFMAPKEKTRWVNLYAGGRSAHFDTELEADTHNRHEALSRIGNKAHPITITE